MSYNKFSLRDKVALITGGSRGIGRAIALGFADAGANVVVSSRKLPDLEKVAEEIRGKGVKSSAVASHMGKTEDIERLMKEVISRMGGLDILVNNAGTNPIFGPILNANVEAWDKIMEVNVRGYFLLGKAAVDVMMKQKGGVIINIASTAGLRPMPMLGVYSVSKAAVIMLTKVMATELAGANIRVNCICPGLIKTKFSTALWSNDDIREEVLRNVPMGRIGEPDEVVGAALYLASDLASLVTGSSVVVDGGGTA